MKLELQVMGMSCAHCEARVVKALTALPGVASAQAFANANRVLIEVATPEVAKATLEQAIERLGYRVIRQ